MLIIHSGALLHRLAGAATTQTTPTAYVTAEPYLAAGTNIGPIPNYGVSNSLAHPLQSITDCSSMSIYHGADVGTPYMFEGFLCSRRPCIEGTTSDSPRTRRSVPLSVEEIGIHRDLISWLTHSTNPINQCNASELLSQEADGRQL